MVILPATEADLQAVIELVAQGRAALARQGVDQWQDGYPSPETIRRDLLCGDGRIVRIDGAAAAYAAFVFDGEPAYDRIEEGGWAAEGPYVAVHRLVVGERFVRRGVAAALLREAAREALVRGIRSFRIFHRVLDEQRSERKRRREEKTATALRIGSYTLPARSALDGTTLGEAEVRRRASALVLGIERPEGPVTNPSAGERLRAGDVVWAVGDPQRMKPFFEAVRQE